MLHERMLRGLSVAAVVCAVTAAGVTAGDQTSSASSQDAAGYLTIPPGTDYYETVLGTALVEIGGLSTIPPVPADSFGPGSDPFEGQVALRGDPIPGYCGAVDTVVVRIDPATMPGPAEVQVELVQLSLVSIDPVVITFFGGTGGSYLYDLHITLNQGIPSVGSMTIEETDPGIGGTYRFDGSVLGGIQLYAQLDFIPLEPTGPGPLTLPLADPIYLEGTAAHPWQYAAPPEACDPTGEFYPTPLVEILTMLDGGLAGRHGIIPPRVVDGCCLFDGTCIDLDPNDCFTLGGNPQGTLCTGTIQGCCLNDGVGTCVNVDPLCCDDMGGFVQGGMCAGVTRPCCLPGGGCIDADPMCCDELGGTPATSGAPACLGDVNPPDGIDDACQGGTQVPQACCLPDGACIDVIHDNCVALGGVPEGAGTDCTNVTCTTFKWAQPPMFNPSSPEPTCYWGWDEWSVYGSLQMVGDDWQCLDERPVSDIHWWGSYQDWTDDAPPPNAPGAFHIALWTDEPVGGDPFSHPRDLIVEWVVPRDLLNERVVGCDYYSEFPYMLVPDTCFKYDFLIPQAEWYYQGPVSTIYWVTISAIYPVPPCPCDGDLNDDGATGVADVAVFTACINAGNPPSGACWRADIDCDGTLGTGDLAAMSCLQAGGGLECCPNSVTEPNAWGWKTRAYEFNDAAVRVLNPRGPSSIDPTFLDGEPTITPDGVWWDMAFVITASDAAPQFPVAVAHANPNPAACNQQIVFDGTASYHENPLRTIVLYEWDFDYDGVTFDIDATGQMAMHSYPQFGTYTAALRVTDDDTPPVTDVDTVDVDISLGNLPPNADAGGPYVMDVGDGITLDGTGSSDPNANCGDSIVSYQWDLDDDGVFDDASTATVPLTWVQIMALGMAYPADPGTGLPNNNIRLRVTDSFGLSTVDLTTLTIYLDEPIAQAVAAPNPAACNQQIMFDGTASYHGHPGHSIVSYEWDFDYDGVTFDVDATGQTVFHAYAQYGTYQAALRVTDDNAPPLTDIDTVTVDVTLGNLPPVADADGPYTIFVGEDLTLDGSGSSDPNTDCGDSIAAYEWDLDDDGQFDDATGATPIVPWANIAAMGLPYPDVPNPIRLRVTDGFGLTNVDNSTLTIVLPVQACCLPDGTCADMTHNDCVAAGGDPQGPADLCDFGVVCSPIKWAQPPTFNPASEHPECFWGWDELSAHGILQVDADDWPCQDGRPVTDIHWWGSYMYWDGIDPPPGAPGLFHIAIWTDVPADPDPFSHPGVVVKEWVVPRSQLNERTVACDFHTNHMMTPESCFKYDFYIPEQDWFIQEPGNNIYWVSIAAMYMGLPCTCNGDVAEPFNGVPDFADVEYVVQHIGCPVGTGDPACDVADVDCDGDVDQRDSDVVVCQFQQHWPDPTCCMDMGPNEWGWKTREHMYMGAAVRILDPTAPTLGSLYVFGDQITPTEPWDMAFVITTSAVLAPPPPLPDDDYDINGTVRTCRDDETRCVLTDVPCDSDADCPTVGDTCRTDCTVGIHATSETYCVPPPTGEDRPGVCYVRRNRYIAIDPNPANAGQVTARRVSLDNGDGTTTVLGWVGAPMPIAVSGPELSPQLLSRIEDAPHYRDWALDDTGGPWVDSTVHVADCETSPLHTYVVQAILDGADTADEANYSEPLVLSTVQDVSGTGGFGDVVGGATGLPPEGVRSFKDISAVVRGFQGTQTEPKSWLDLQGPVTTSLCPTFEADGIDFKDIDWAVKGFQGWTYLIGPPPDNQPTGFYAPLECPPNACPTGARLRDYSHGPCQRGGDSGKPDRGGFCPPDVIELTPSPGELHMMHRNAAYNCCMDDVIVTLTVDGNTLRLSEEEVVGMPCDCICCFDIEATVDNLAPGTYTVDVCWIDPDLGGETCDQQVVEIP